MLRALHCNRTPVHHARLLRQMPEKHAVRRATWQPDVLRLTIGTVVRLNVLNRANQKVPGMCRPPAIHSLLLRQIQRHIDDHILLPADHPAPPKLDQDIAWIDIEALCSTLGMQKKG